MKDKTYVLLKTGDGNSQSTADTVRRQPGVISVDQVEGSADIIFAVQATSRKRLAELTVKAISSVESFAEDVQLLPVKEVVTSRKPAIVK